MLPEASTPIMPALADDSTASMKRRRLSITSLALTNSSRFVVNETPLEVLEMIRDWRAGILTQALENAENRSSTDLAQVVHLTRSVELSTRDS